jgi:hypothetical protein
MPFPDSYAPDGSAHPRKKNANLVTGLQRDIRAGIEVHLALSVVQDHRKVQLAFQFAQLPGSALLTNSRSGM